MPVNEKGSVLFEVGRDQGESKKKYEYNTADDLTKGITFNEEGKELIEPVPLVFIN